MESSVVSPLARSEQVGEWLRRVIDRVVQEPLVDTAASLNGLRCVDREAPPDSVMIGVGLCTPGQLSREVPLDLLGMVLPAELIRRAAGAKRLIAVVADRHALSNDFDPDLVEDVARNTQHALEALRRRLGLQSMRVVRASSFHNTAAYRDSASRVRRGLETTRPSAADNDYLVRQLADVAYLWRTCGGVVKVGWTVGNGNCPSRRDEVAFDTLTRACVGTRIPFVYCKPGRSLQDNRPKVPPYIATQPAGRICLKADERPRRKLVEAARRASADTIRGCRRHLKAIVYTYAREVAPLPRAPLEGRLEALIRGVTDPLSIL